MQQALAHVSLLVRDYDEALAFYVDTLGFRVVEDSPRPDEGKRWVVVGLWPYSGICMAISGSAAVQRVGCVERIDGVTSHQTGAMHGAADQRPDPGASMSSPEKRRLTRSRDKWLFGVCGGIASHFGWRPGSVRIAWCFGTLLTAGAGGIVVYLLLAAVMPPPPRAFDINDFRVQ